MSEIYGNAVKTFAYISLIIELSKGRKMTGYDVLVHLKRFGLEVSPGTVYYQLEKLEKAGIVERIPVKRRKASKSVYELSDKGVEQIKEFKDKWREPVRYAYQNIVATHQDVVD